MNLRAAVRTLAVPASAVAGSLISYALLLAAARLLSHAAYGSFVALTTLMVVGAVPSLAMQAVAARRVAGGDGTAGVAPVTVALALGVGLVPALLATPLDAFLHIDSSGATLWLALGLVPLTVSGPLIGVAQGAERFTLFAVLTLVQACGRFGGCLLPLLLGHGEAAAMAGAALGNTLAAALAHVLVRRAGLGLSIDRTRRHARSVLAEAGHALHGYGAILLLSSFDLLLARHVVSAEQAAQYAAGSVVTKAVVWLPQSIGLIVFARMAAHDPGRRVVRRAAGVVAAIGVLATAGAALFGGTASAVVGGHFGVVASSGWRFALLGGSLAVLQFTVVAGLATRAPRRLAVVWLAVAGEAVVIPALGSGAGAAQVAGAVAAVVGVAAVVSVWLAAELPLPRRRPAADHPALPALR